MRGSLCRRMCGASTTCTPAASSSDVVIGAVRAGSTKWEGAAVVAQIHSFLAKELGS